MGDRTPAFTDAETVPIVYDVGMNFGDDSEYYLAKGYAVVGIDANPAACAHCEERFSDEIRQGRMTVVNMGVADRAGSLAFHVNRAKHRISTFLPERFADEEWVVQEWDVLDIPVEPLSLLIARFGSPHFIKIDVEFFDQTVLKDLLRNDVRPPFISAEAHDIDVFCALVCMGYQRFQLTPGATVSERYGDATIARIEGTRIPHAFPFDSSGPFGEDLPGDWLDKNEALAKLLAHGLGWIDIHAAL
jgi:FkbM family methyltransferase